MCMEKKLISPSLLFWEDILIFFGEQYWLLKILFAPTDLILFSYDIILEHFTC